MQAEKDEQARKAGYFLFVKIQILLVTDEEH